MGLTPYRVYALISRTAISRGLTHFSCKAAVSTEMAETISEGAKPMTNLVGEKQMATNRQAEERVHVGFWFHLTCYVIVVSGLAALNYQRNPDNLWVLWVAGGWGIGIAAHAIAFFTQRGRELLIERTEARMDRREEGRAEREERRDAGHYRDGHDPTHMTDKMSEAAQRPV